MNERQTWDSAALRAIAEYRTKTGESYVGQVHLKAVEKALRCAEAKILRVLKTDLWNEGIELGRDILGMLEDDRSLSLVGVDLSAIVCQRAKSRLKRTDIIQASIRRLPIKDEHFDVVLDFSTIDHVVPDEIPTVIREYRRALKNSGIMLVSFWHPARILKLIGALGRASYPQYYLDTRRMRALIGRGFDIVEEYNTLGSGMAVLLQMRRRLGRLSAVIHDLILLLEYSRQSKFLLGDVAGIMIIIARKRSTS